MIKITGHRLLIQPRELVKEKKVEGTDKIIAVAYGANEGRQEAGINEGTVVEVGPIAYQDRTYAWCKQGDYILFAKYSGVSVTDPETEKKYVIINDEDVLCVITGIKGEA